MEYLLKFDVALFYIINVGLQNPFFDWFMPFITERNHWFPVWAVVIVGLLWKGGRKGRTVIVLIIPLIFMSDQISAHVLKPLIGRQRPCVALTDIHLLVGMKTSLSFPSAHATNFFALATFFNYFYPKYRWWYFGAASLVALSRVSVGVHYPLDIIGGAILGALCAWTIIAIWKVIEQQWERRRV